MASFKREKLMLIALVKRYHHWLCATGAKTDVKRITAQGPTAGLPWAVGLLAVVVISSLIEKFTGQSLWFGPPYIRWVVGAAVLAPFAGYIYATFTVFICCWRAEMRKDR